MNTHFIVISVIDFPNRKLSYSSVRSAFTKEERLEQTKESIVSIQKHAPGATITLIENGLTDYTQEFSTLFPSIQYIYRGTDTLTAAAVRSSYKACGEIISMLHALTLMQSSPKMLCFKLSGRYALNEHFSQSAWKDSAFNFKQIGHAYSTRLYAFPSTYKVFLYSILLTSLPLVFLNISIEEILKILIPRRYIYLQEHLGVTGRIGVNKDSINE